MRRADLCAVALVIARRAPGARAGELVIATGSGPTFASKETP